MDNKFKILVAGLVFALLTCLLIVYYGFDIRLKLLHKFHYLIPIVLIIIRNLLIALTIIVGIRLKTNIAVKILFIMGFIIGSTVLLYHTSSINRETEVLNYLLKSEKSFLRVINNDNTTSNMKMDPTLKREMNIRTFKYYQNEYHFGLYGFMGYGYRIMYTKKKLVYPPGLPTSSPTVKWHQIKENWYYYSFWD